MKVYNKYVKDVVQGKVLACQENILACQRHLDDLQRKDWEWYFDEKEADRYIKFIKLFRLVEGDLQGKPIPLLPFQEFIIASIFGWRNKKTGLRRFNDTYIQMPKKNAKTTLIAVMMSAMFFLEREGMGQYLFAATNRAQANIAFKAAKNMIKKFVAEYDIKEMVSITIPAIEHNENNSSMMAVSKEADSVEGKHATASSADEYHLHKTDEIINNIKSGMGGRTQPILFRITTPGNDLFSPCFTFYEYAKNVLTGHLEDERLFTIVFGIDPDDDPWNEDTWQKANPAIGLSPKWEFIRGQAKQARNLGGAKMADFLTKHLGRWVSSSKGWVKDDLILDIMKPVDLSKEHGGVAGLDMAVKNDITAFCIRFDSGAVFWRYFIPEHKLKNRADGVDYNKWVNEGHMIVTTAYEGESIDFSVVEETIAQDCERFGVSVVYYDDWNISQMVQNLRNQGINMVGYGAGFKEQSPIISALLTDITEKSIYFDNPVSRWMFTNIRVKENQTGHQRFVKDGYTARIDGIMALLYAKAAHVLENRKPKKKKPKIFTINTNANGHA